MEQIKNYIDGELQAPLSGSYLDNYDPAVGEVYSKIPDSNEKDVEKAVCVAKDAFGQWSTLSIEKRSAYLNRLADLIDKNANRLARAETIDNGKPLSLASKVDIPRASSNLRYFAAAITTFASESHSMPGLALNYTLRDPLGVVGCISPWNLPLYLFTWKIAPALACGNCVVAKPSEITPMTAFLFSELCLEAGLPPGVLNIVHGAGPTAGNALVTHPDVCAVSFTGGTKTGTAIAKQAASELKKVSLELGGKNPNIIFADCDYEKALKTTVQSSFANQGQICLCGSRVYIERPLYEKFKQDLVEEAKKLKVGDPLEPDTAQGALVSKEHKHKVLSYLDLARAEGGSILCGGEEVNVKGRCANGNFISPTVIEGLGIDCRTNQEEIFGPVVTISPFDSEQEAISLANHTKFGLASSVWTSDLTRAHRVSSAIKAGMVWVNCWLLRDLRTPFGGMKASGQGREGGVEALRFFTEPKNVCIRI